MVRILLLEDDTVTAGAIASGLAQRGYEVEHAADVPTALAAVERISFDAAILDVMVPGGSGYDVLAALRAKSSGVPCLILTARDELADRVEGLDRGADDYLVKPFALVELAARLRALLRRPPTRVETVRLAGFEVDLLHRSARFGDVALALTPKELDLLHCLLARRRRGVDAQAIFSNSSGAITSTPAPTWSRSTSTGCAGNWRQPARATASARSAAPGTRSMRDARPFWRRVDVQMGISVGIAIASLLVVLMGVLFFVASHEAAETVDEALTTDLRRAAFELQPGGADVLSEEPITEGTAIRLIDAGGDARTIIGAWPEGPRLFSHRTTALRLAFAAHHDFLIRTMTLPDGSRLEGAASLADFVEDRREQMTQLGAALIFGLVGVVAIAIYATRRALEPLRTATRELEAVDERRLDARLAVRGTGDDLDRHAIALNRVFARLEDSFLRLSTFSANVAHELRTPVNRMLNLADVALLSPNGTASAEVVAIRESADEMRRLIERLLLLARGDAGRLPLHRAPVELFALGQDLAELFQPSCEQRGVTLRVHSHGDHPIANVDAGLLQQALSNLLDNAIRHAPEGTEIHLEIGADADVVTLAVSDAGPGIAAPDRERIFDHFVQLDASRTGNGTGLGLAIVRMIARLHGGDVTVATSQLGGARFEIRIARHPGRGNTEIRAPRSQSPTRGHEDSVILPSLT